MPIGPYENFAACHSAMMAKGKSDESAKKICGAMEKQMHGAEIQEKDGHLYIKSFLLDSSVNLNEWGVSKDTLDNNISSFIGRPIVITEDFDHPMSNDPNFEHHIDYQDRFRIGTIIDIVNKDGVYSAIAEITNEDAKNAFREGNLPLYVSPQLYHDSVGKEPDNNMTQWRGTHLAIVKEPAFGVKKARVSGQCNGDQQTCLAQLKKASCSFCIKKTIENYKNTKLSFIPHKPDPNIILNYVSNNSSLVSSLGKQKLIKKGKLENDNDNVKQVSLEEHEKLQEQLKAAKEEISSLKSLTSEKDNVISELKQGNESLNSRVAEIEKRERTKEVANILSAVTFKTDEERTKRLETLVSSNLDINSIKETYEPLMSANLKQAVKETKLPQKSAAVNEQENKVPAWLSLYQFQLGGSN